MPKIECKYNPKDLIEQIGDCFFWICEEENIGYKHPDHPHIIRIRDCECETVIDVASSFGFEETRILAENLCKLLNQEYENA